MARRRSGRARRWGPISGARLLRRADRGRLPCRHQHTPGAPRTRLPVWRRGRQGYGEQGQSPSITRLTSQPDRYLHVTGDRATPNSNHITGGTVQLMTAGVDDGGSLHESCSDIIAMCLAVIAARDSPIPRTASAQSGPVHVIVDEFESWHSKTCRHRCLRGA